MNLSIPSLMISICVVGATTAMTLAIVGLRHSRELGIWSGAFGAFSICMLLVSFRGYINDYVSIVVANSALSLSFALFLIGILQFHKKSIPIALIWLPVVAVLLSFHFALDNPIGRTVIINSVCLFQSCTCVFALYRSRPEMQGRGQYAVMTGFLSLSAILAMRVTVTLLGQLDSPSVIATNTVQNITFLVTIAAVTLLGIGVSSMIQERAELALAENREILATQNKTLERYAAELRVLNAKLVELSNSDGLTSLNNRRHFDETLAVEWTRAKRSGSTVTLYMIDVDFFKQFNDAYGHPAGDACLKRVAALLQSSLRRASDFAARYGGEEFAVLTTDLTEEQAQDLGRFFIDGVAALNIPHSQSPFARVTVSVGVATASPAQAAGEPEQLIRSADAALYRAKQSGRNCLLA